MGRQAKCRYCDKSFESNKHFKYYCSDDHKLMGRRMRKMRNSRKSYYKKKQTAVQ